MKIIIVGCAGSGKTTLAKALGDIYQLPIIHLDQYYWQKNWVASTKEEWKYTLDQLMNQHQDWIMDGNYTSSIEKRIEQADRIIFLDFSRLTCLFGVIKRRITFHKKVRHEMPEGCYEKIDREFLSWIWHYNRKQRPKLIDAMGKYPNKEYCIFKTRKEVNMYLFFEKSKNKK